MSTVLGTRLGTLLGAQLGTGAESAGVVPIYALSGFSAANWYQTQAGGGEAGVATGFGFALPFIVTSQAVASAPRVVFDNLFTTPVEGWTLNTGGTNTNVSAAFVSGAAAAISTPTITITASDVGRVLVAVGWLTGTGEARLMLLRGAYVSAAITGYTPATARLTSVGKRGNVGNFPSDGLATLGCGMTFRGPPSLAQLAELYDVIRRKGDVPTPAEWPYGITHRWSLRDALAGSTPTHGQVAPATLADTVTGAAIDAMARQGSPTVSVIDASVDGRKSYGVLGFSTASYLQSAVAVTPGSTIDLTVEITLHATTASKWILSNSPGGGTGFDFYTSSSTAITVFAYGIGAVASAAISAADVGVKTQWRIQYTGTVWRLYKGGVQQGADNAAGYNASTSPLRVGVSGGITGPADTVSISRVTIGSAHDYDITRDVEANGGPQNGVPATIQDRIGTDHLTRVGTGLQVAQRTERVWSYETTPIMYGAGSFTSASSYESAVGACGGVPDGFFGVVAFIPHATTSAATRVLVSSRNQNPFYGWQMHTTGTHSALMATIGATGTGTGADYTTPISILSAADIGRVHFVAFTLNPVTGKIHLFSRRVEQGTGATFQGVFRPRAEAPLIVGRRAGDFYPASDTTIVAAGYGLGILSLAEYQSLYDAFVANEQLTMSGKLMNAWDFTSSARANGGALPATVADLGGTVNLSRTGLPTTAPIYARAFAA